MADEWEHHKIVKVTRQRHFPTWLVQQDDGNTTGVGMDEYPGEPQVGDIISTICRGSYVVACAIGEHLCHDYRSIMGGVGDNGNG